MTLTGVTAPERTLAAVDYMETHVNCRCVMVPRVKSYAEIVGDPSLPDNRPQRETGAEAFARLPHAQQRSILGPGKFDLYQRGMPLDAMWKTSTHIDWGRSRIGKSLRELRAEVDAGMWVLQPPRPPVALPDVYSGAYADPKSYGYDTYPTFRDSLYRDAFGGRVVSLEAADAVHEYAGRGYRAMNAFWRGGYTLDDNFDLALTYEAPSGTSDPFRFSGAGMRATQQQLRALENAFVIKLPHAVNLKRGTGYIQLPDGIASPEDALGMVLEEQGYMSTSTTIAFAGRYQLKIVAPQGMPVAFANFDEQELVFPRNTKYVITKAEREASSIGPEFDAWELDVRLVLPE